MKYNKIFNYYLPFKKFKIQDTIIHFFHLTMKKIKAKIDYSRVIIIYCTISYHLLI